MGELKDVAPLFRHKWGPRWALDDSRESLDALWATTSARSQSLQHGLWPGLLVPLAFDAPVLNAVSCPHSLSARGCSVLSIMGLP